MLALRQVGAPGWEPGLIVGGTGAVFGALSLAAITEVEDATNNNAHSRILGDMIHSAGFEGGGNKPEECVVSVGRRRAWLRQDARSRRVFALAETRGTTMPA